MVDVSLSVGTTVVGRLYLALPLLRLIWKVCAIATTLGYYYYYNSRIINAFSSDVFYDLPTFTFRNSTSINAVSWYVDVEFEPAQIL